MLRSGAQVGVSAAGDADVSAIRPLPSGSVADVRSAGTTAMPL